MDSIWMQYGGRVAIETMRGHRPRALGQLQRVLLLLIVAVGIIFLIAADKAEGTLASVLREAGIVTIGTVMVSLVYEFVLRREHDKQLLQVVEDCLIPKAGEYGLSGIEPLDFAELFGRIEESQQLLWLDTYCPDLDNPEVQDALKEALSRRAVIKMLVIDPDSATAEARAREIAAPGYRAEEFQSDARHNLMIVHGILADLSQDCAERLEVRTYTGLPCAPIYLRVKDGQPIEGWSSYFLTLPTYKSAHLYWGRAPAVTRKLSAGPGLGLRAFQNYFEKKWDAAGDWPTGRSGSEPTRVVEDLRTSFTILAERNYEFVRQLFADDLERLMIEPLHKVLDDGKLRRDQTGRSRDLLLDLAQDEEILLVHSTSENAIFEDVAFWRPFNEQLLRRVQRGQLHAVRRLFVLSSPTADQADPVFKGLVDFHHVTDGFTCRLITRANYRAIQEDVHVTSFPVHDFGVYGRVAYVWPREGYANHSNNATRGYFQVDPVTVAKFRELYERCWGEATPSEVAFGSAALSGGTEASSSASDQG